MQFLPPLSLSYSLADNKRLACRFNRSEPDNNHNISKRLTMRHLTLSCLLSTTFLIACGGGGSDSPPATSSSASSSSVVSSSSQSSSSSLPSFALPITLENDQAIVFYHRDDGAYDGWGLHLWNTDNC